MSCRRAVAAGAVVLCALAVLLIFALGLPWIARAVSASVFVVFSGYKLAQFLHAHGGLDRLRVFPGGRAQVRRTHCWHEAHIAPGSVVYPGIAWLLVCEPGRPRVGLLFRRGAVGTAEWRRLLVISRHVGG